MIVRATLAFVHEKRAIRLPVDLEVGGETDDIKILPWKNPATPLLGDSGSAEERRPDLAFVDFEALKDELFARADHAALCILQERLDDNVSNTIRRDWKGDKVVILGLLDRTRHNVNLRLDEADS